MKKILALILVVAACAFAQGGIFSAPQGNVTVNVLTNGCDTACVEEIVHDTADVIRDEIQDSVNTDALVVNGTTRTAGRRLNFVEFAGADTTYTMADSMDVVYLNPGGGNAITFNLQTLSSDDVGRRVTVIFALNPGSAAAATIGASDGVVLPTGESVAALPHEMTTNVYMVAMTLVWTGGVWLVVDQTLYFGGLS